MTSDELLLIDRWRDGELDAVTHAGFLNRLASDATFAREFTQEMRWQGQIASLLDAEDSAASLVARVEGIIAGSTISGTHRLMHRIDRLVAEPPVSAPFIAARPRVVAQSTRRLRRPVRRSPLRWGPALAAVLALGTGLGVGGWWLQRPQPAIVHPSMAAQGTAGAVDQVPVAPRASDDEVANLVMPILDVQSVAVRIIRAGCTTTDDAVPGQALHAGDQLSTTGRGHAVLDYPDGTLVACTGESRLTVDAEPRGARVLLSAGTLSAHIAKQPSGHLMAFRTPQAVATVIGTRISLATQDGVTTVTVSEGRVAFAAIGAEEHPLMVDASMSAVAHAGAVSLVSPGEVGSSPLWANAAALDAIISPTDKESAWTRIAWRTSITQARRDAVSSGRPLLVWVGWGHPLGCTSTDSLRPRVGTFADPRIIALVNDHVIPLAVDAWWLKRRQDPDARMLEQALEQSFEQAHPDMNGTTAAQTKEGLYCLTPAGARGPGDRAMISCGAPNEDLVDFLRSACLPPVPFHDRTTTVPPSLPGDARDPHLPAHSLIASIFGRALTLEGGQWRVDATLPEVFQQPGRDQLWLSPAECMAFFPDQSRETPRIGQQYELPRPLFLKLARYVLCDSTRGESQAWEIEDVHAGSMRLRLDAITPHGWAMRLEGHCDLHDANRGFDVNLVGWIEGAALRTGQDVHIHRFDLIALGDQWGEERYAAPARPGRARFGSAVHLDRRPEAAAIPPHGLRDADYMTALQGRFTLMADNVASLAGEAPSVPRANMQEVDTQGSDEAIDPEEVPAAMLQPA